MKKLLYIVGIVFLSACSTQKSTWQKPPSNSAYKPNYMLVLDSISTGTVSSCDTGFVFPISTRIMTIPFTKFDSSSTHSIVNQ